MGPNFMRDLTWLANEVVKPILENIEPGGFTVSTPSFQKIGNVMYQVIQACDRAATGGGKSYGQQSKRPLRNGSPGCYGPRLRPLKIGDDADVEKDKVPFDRAAYRAFVIPRETNGAIAALTGAIEEILTSQTTGIPFQNPLTAYFGVPLSAFFLCIWFGARLLPQPRQASRRRPRCRWL